eukprot:TRINITY_DN1764_c0_g1_i6.p2 TRINITY_DN1764_c0_g1~~TRINITY_DN1764_c0_g1_i6.p2  ORF type:complete len:104 (-),score=6.08 TRINITY_DN1764_c0_g1_i6:164-475(-)
MQRGLVGSEMCIRDRYQRRVHGGIATGNGDQYPIRPQDRMIQWPKIYRYEMDPRLISQLVRQWLTKATISSRPERVIGHTGTETRSKLLREAAVGNIAQWAKA